MTSSSNPYQQCLLVEDSNSSPEALLECVAVQLSTKNSADTLATNSILLVFAAALVFFMQAGFAMICAGCVRKKNVQNTMLKNLLDACGASLGFFAIGYALAFGGDDPTSNKTTFVGNTNFFLMNVELGGYAFFLYQWAFSAASATIVAGTLAERCQMTAYFGYSVMLCAWVYPVVAHSIWSPQGFLSAYAIEPLFGTGMVDYAGSGVVHVTGGLTALLATKILGARQGRFFDEDGEPLKEPKEIQGHSMALQMLGTFILWFGWYGFNGGSALLQRNYESRSDTLSLAAVNTTVACGSGCIIALFLNLFVLERVTGEPYFDLKYAMNGALSGLVSVTAGCGIFQPWAAIVVGVVGGIFYVYSSRLMIRLRLDDVVDAIPVHLVSGAWGLISVGLMADPRFLLLSYGRDDHAGLFYSWNEGHSDARLLGVQLLGLLFIIGWVSVIMLPFFYFLDLKGWFRADSLEEIVGLDTSYHGGLTQLLERRFLNEGEEIPVEATDAMINKKSEHISRVQSRTSSFASIISQEKEDEESKGRPTASVSNTSADVGSISESKTATAGMPVMADSPVMAEKEEDEESKGQRPTTRVSNTIADVGSAATERKTTTADKPIMADTPVMADA